LTDQRKEFFQKQLSERRQKLLDAKSATGSADQLVHLLAEVDAALSRLKGGTFGLCEVCHEPVEEERLLANPLMRLCIDHLTNSQQRDLEDDLQLANRIQLNLIPRQDKKLDQWQFHYFYRPAGIVSGDYLDLIYPNEGQKSFYVLLGDVSGKGIAASMLMAHLHATFRSLIIQYTALDQIAMHANRIFCESTMSSQYATLIVAKFETGGQVEICNAGHNYPVVIQNGTLKRLAATGLPLGMFCNSTYSVSELQLAPSDKILFYTDGLTEALNESEVEYGEDRLLGLLAKNQELAPKEMIESCLEDLQCFGAGHKLQDDLTISVIQKS